MTAIGYAEDTLGVHSVLEKAVEAHEQLDKICTVLSEHRDTKRQLETELSDREMEIIIAERGKHADMSQAQMDKHVRMALHSDKEYQTLRGQLAEVLDTLDGAEFDRKVQERAIEIGCARMNELGGYLNYLAAVKNAATATRTTSS